MEKGKLVLELMVETYQDRIVELDSKIGHVKMIPFGGTVKGEIFNGIIEPCGVDTQVTNQAGDRPKPWISTPSFMTDSAKLSTYLHTNQFVGEGIRVEEGLRIRYYEVK